MWNKMVAAQNYVIIHIGVQYIKFDMLGWHLMMLVVNSGQIDSVNWSASSCELVVKFKKMFFFPKHLGQAKREMQGW